MTALTPVIPSRTAGADLQETTTAGTAAANGDTFPAGPDTYLRVRNTGTAVTPTIVGVTAGGPLGVDYGSLALPQVAANGDRLFGPFPQVPFGNQLGLVTVNYSQVTGVFVYAYNFQGN